MWGTRIAGSPSDVLPHNVMAAGEPLRLYFVCTSNTCRSPMAEVIAKRWLAARGGFRMDDLEEHSMHVHSRGLTTDFEPEGTPMNPNSVAALRSLGIPGDRFGVATHRSQMMRPEEVAGATMVVCMAHRHKTAVLDMCPQASDKTIVLEPEIPDPWGGSQSVYTRCAQQLSGAVHRALEVAFGGCGGEPGG